MVRTHTVATSKRNHRDPAALEERAKKRANEPQFYGSKLVLKKDTQMVVEQPMEFEDEFDDFYRSRTRAEILTPPFNPLELKGVVTRNNILPQCIEAMEVNIDGTGHEIALKEGEKDNEEEKKNIESFFKEPFPGMSMITLRRLLRNDRESTGYGYVEVVRNAGGDFRFLRHMDAATMRLVKLDEPIEKEFVFERNGKEEKLNMWARERRFAQVIGRKVRYYKEYGSSRNLNKITGEWETPGKSVPLKNRASEVLYFPVKKDAKTAYGVPRWINNLPSALGSRKSEEMNLEYFDSGGLPPAIIFLLGGTMGDTVAKQLNHFLSGGAKSKLRAAVVEAMASGGSIEGKENSVNVKVERFGESRNDSMFMKYDEVSGEHVRLAFRIPPIMLGKAADYNFATAMTAILIAEAQVFGPEREEFDETINRTIMKELGATVYEFKSKPMFIMNADLQMKAMEFAKDMVKGEELIEALNSLTGLNLQYDQATVDANKPQFPGMPGEEGEERPMLPGERPPQDPNAERNRPGASGVGNPQDGRPRLRVVSSKSVEHYGPMEVANLADLWAEVMELSPTTRKISAEEKRTAKLMVDALPADSRALFNRMIAQKQYSQIMEDPEGLSDIVGCCTELVAKHARG